MFPQRTPHWARLGSEASLDEGDVFPIWCSKETLELQRPESVTITFMFFRDFAYESGWRKGHKHRTRLDIFGSQLIVSWVPATRLQSQVIMSFTGHLWRKNRGRSFWAESSVVKEHGNHMGQDEARVITCFSALSVSWSFYSWEQVHGDNQRYWWCPWNLMILVISSLCTHPWVQSWFSLVIAPGSPFLGRL